MPLSSASTSTSTDSLRLSRIGGIARLAAGRRRILLPALLSAALIAVGYWQFDTISHAPSADLSFTGDISGTMTQLRDSDGHHSGCRVGDVEGTEQWDGQFVGMVNGHRMEFSIALTPYHGSGAYVNDEIRDPRTLATMSMDEFTRLKSPIHLLLSSMPTGAPDVRLYGTEPAPGHVATSAHELAEYPPLGQASLTLDPDQKSGHVRALLMNANAPASPTVRVDGRFKCGRLDPRPA